MRQHPTRAAARESAPPSTSWIPYQLGFDTVFLPLAHGDAPPLNCAVSRRRVEGGRAASRRSSPSVATTSSSPTGRDPHSWSGRCSPDSRPTRLRLLRARPARRAAAGRSRRGPGPDPHGGVGRADVLAGCRRECLPHAGRGQPRSAPTSPIPTGRWQCRTTGCGDGWPRDPGRPGGGCSSSGAPRTAEPGRRSLPDRRGAPRGSCPGDRRAADCRGRLARSPPVCRGPLHRQGRSPTELAALHDRHLVALAPLRFGAGAEGKLGMPWHRDSRW